MKIAHLISSNTFGGIEQHVYELANKMSEESEQIIICNKKIHSYIKDVNKVSIKIGSRYSPLNIFRLLKYLKHNKISLLHCHGAKASTIGKLIRYVSKIKVVSTIHGHKKNNKPFMKVDAVIGVNKKLLRGISNGTYIPNWFNNNHQGKQSTRKGPILAVGRLEKVKGFDHLIQSWINIENKLDIVGSGPEEKSLRSLIDYLNLQDKIKIITNCDYNSIEEKYKDASGLIVASIREGGPRVLLEAINHEIPVVGTRVGIMSELIADEFLCEPNNQRSLQSLLEEIIPLLPNLNMIALKETLKERYSIEIAASKTKKIYDVLLSASL